MVSPYFPTQEEGNPRGELMKMGVKDCGESECLPVMGRIKIETSSYAKAGRLPQGILLRETWRTMRKGISV